MENIRISAHHALRSLNVVACTHKKARASDTVHVEGTYVVERQTYCQDNIMKWTNRTVRAATKKSFRLILIIFFIKARHAISNPYKNPNNPRVGFLHSLDSNKLTLGAIVICKGFETTYPAYLHSRKFTLPSWKILVVRLDIFSTWLAKWIFGSVNKRDAWSQTPYKFVLLLLLLSNFHNRALALSSKVSKAAQSININSPGNIFHI